MLMQISQELGPCIKLLVVAIAKVKENLNPLPFVPTTINNLISYLPYTCVSSINITS